MRSVVLAFIYFTGAGRSAVAEALVPLKGSESNVKSCRSRSFESGSLFGALAV